MDKRLNGIASAREQSARFGTSLGNRATAAAWQSAGTIGKRASSSATTTAAVAAGNRVISDSESSSSSSGEKLARFKRSERARNKVLLLFGERQPRAGAGAS